MSEPAVFAAIADPTRRKIILNLAGNSPKTASQLSKEFPITRQGILKHLDILEEAGLVKIHQKGREKRYTLTPEPLDEADRWIQRINAKWEKRLLRLKRFVEQRN